MLYDKMLYIHKNVKSPHLKKLQIIQNADYPDYPFLMAMVNWLYLLACINLYFFI